MTVSIISLDMQGERVMQVYDQSKRNEELANQIRKQKEEQRIKEMQQREYQRRERERQEQEDENAKGQKDE
jgi:hypothetical protein